MPRIDEMPEFRARLPKESHVLDHRFGFTCTCAHLLPVYHDFVNAGETVELGFDFKLRTQPLQSAAMVKLITHTEYFFVPMQLLYEPFGSMYYGISDNYSSLYPQVPVGVQSVFPVLDFQTLQGYLHTNYGDTIDFETWGNQAVRLFDHLAFNNEDLLGVASTINQNPNTFPYGLLAYHCIYQYYYRLDNRELFDQYLFNWDKYYNTPLVTLSLADYKKLVSIHLRPKDDDYFTNVKVSPIVDTLNLNVKNSFALAQNWLSRTYIKNNSPVLISGGVGQDNYYQNRFAPTGSSFNNPSTIVQTNFGFNTVETATNFDSSYIPLNGQDINTANLRALFANEKLWSITGRAKKHYDDQTLAHFGFKVPHDVKHQITCFGHDRNLITIGEVISTADTTNAALGEIAGKGYSESKDNKHKFVAPCHGVVMAIFSIVPEITYGGSYGKFNQMTSPNDLFQPEYDHLGMQPLFAFETHPSDNTRWSKIIGWQYRYEQWKRRYNRVTAAFAPNGSLNSWMLSINAPSSDNQADFAQNYLPYYHNPTELNKIMIVNYITSIDPTTQSEEEVYDGDPFVVDGFVRSRKLSTMSSYSLPRLDA